MEIKTCEEYVLNEYLRLQDAVTGLNQEYQRVRTEAKNLQDIVVFLRNLITAENKEDKFEIKFSDAIYNDDANGKFYRDALLGLFGPEKVALNPIDPPAQTPETAENKGV